MFRLKPVLPALTATLVLNVVTPVFSKDVPKVLFQCNSVQHPSICTALAEALRSHAPGLNLTVAEFSEALTPDRANQASDLTIRYIEQERSDDWLSGKLVWQDQEGRSVDGPVLELSVMDSKLEGLNLAPFARALVEVSDLPI